jgi:Zn-finger nucleic acid-binding protein
MIASEPTDKPCSRCEAPLFRASLGDFSLLGCGRCGGVWLGREAAADVMTGQVASAAILAAKLAANTELDPTLLARAASCPECRKPLAQTNVLGTSLDVCTTHGVWFDRGELQAVMRAAAPAPAAAQLRAISCESSRLCYPWLARYAKLCPVLAAVAALVGLLELVAQLGWLGEKPAFSLIDVVTTLLGTAVVVVSILASGNAAEALLELSDRPLVRE